MSLQFGEVVKVQRGILDNYTQFNGGILIALSKLGQGLIPALNQKDFDADRCISDMQPFGCRTVFLFMNGVTFQLTFDDDATDDTVREVIYTFENTAKAYVTYQQLLEEEQYGIIAFMYVATAFISPFGRIPVLWLNTTEQYNNTMEKIKPVNRYINNEIVDEWLVILRNSFPNYPSDGTMCYVEDSTVMGVPICFNRNCRLLAESIKLFWLGIPVVGMCIASWGVLNTSDKYGLSCYFNMMNLTLNATAVDGEEVKVIKEEQEQYIASTYYIGGSALNRLVKRT